MNSVLTPWFPTTVRPVRVGLYLTRLDPNSITVLCHWTGTKWRYGTGEYTTLQDREWRGLSFNPEPIKHFRASREQQAYCTGWYDAHWSIAA